MLTAVLFIMSKKQKQPKHLPVDEWINETWYTLTMEYGAIFKKEPIYATTWINLKSVMLSKNKATKRPNIKILLYEILRTGESRDRTYITGCLGLGMGIKMGTSGCGVSLWSDEKGLKL